MIFRSLILKKNNFISALSLKSYYHSNIAASVNSFNNKVIIYNIMYIIRYTH